MMVCYVLSWFVTRVNDVLLRVNDDLLDKENDGDGDGGGQVPGDAHVHHLGPPED